MGLGRKKRGGAAGEAEEMGRGGEPVDGEQRGAWVEKKRKGRSGWPE